MIQADLMQLSAQLRFRLPRSVFIEVPVKASSAHMRRITGFCDGQSRLALKLHHFSVQRVSPNALFFERASFTRLKALLKKSFSSARRPSRRSSSAILCSELVEAPATALTLPGLGPRRR